MLLGVRVIRSGSFTYLFLVWNLFLAAIPVVAAMALRRAMAGNRRRAIVLSAVTWLLFLPNAPYIATDLMHLRPRSSVPLWYDVALLLSCAVTGILLGYISVAEVQKAVRARLGNAVTWIGVAGVLFASGFGIYLGRFLRWNSWHVVTQPGPLLIDLATRVLHPWSHPRTFAVTAVYGVTLFVGYVVFHLLVATRGTEEPRNRGTGRPGDHDPVYPMRP